MASVVGNLNPDVWSKDIADLLFPDDSFLMMSMDDTDQVDGGRTVHLIQAGAAPVVVEDRASGAVAPVQRTDTRLSYQLYSYTSTPSLLRDAEALETSYDKRKSLLAAHLSTLFERMCLRAGYEWGVTPSRILRTTGALRAPEAAAATGTRKAFTLNDLKLARAKLNADNVPQDGRVAVLTAQMYEDLTGDTAISNASAFGKVVLPDGVVERVHGFDIMLRTAYVTYDNAGTPVAKVPGAVGAITDNLGSLFFHKDFVRRAKGSVQAFLQEKDPTLYGDVFSFEAFAGFSRRYTAGTGIVAVVEIP